MYMCVCVCVSLCVYHFSSVAQLCLTLCNPMGCKHSGHPCPSPTCSNSCPSSWWCHPAISSSVVSFSSCLQSFPASGSFPVSQFFTSGGQSIGVYVYIRTYVCGLPWWASGWLSGKEHTCHWRRYGSIPGRSPGEGNRNSRQCSCWENSMDRGAWHAVMHGVTKSQTQLSDWTELNWT